MTTATTAVSVVDIGTTFRVTHDYHPSPSTPNAYEVSVSVKNISAAATHLRYRRVMDWDIEPTAFSEFVTLFKGSSPFLDFTSNDGFATSNPLAGPSDIGQTGSFTDAGPDDHGALFDFDFGSLAAGATREFKTFYGAAGDRDRRHQRAERGRRRGLLPGRAEHARRPDARHPQHVPLRVP